MEMVKAMSENWWLLMLRGLAMLIVGLAFIAWPAKSVFLITSFVAIIMVVDGAIAAVSGLVSIKKDSNWWVTLIQGVLGAVLGLLIFNWPNVTVGVLFFILAVWILMSGVLSFVAAVAIRKESYGNWTLTGLGVIGLLVGILLLSYPTQSIAVFVVLVGAFTVVSGIMNIAFSLDLRKIHSDLK